MSVPSQTFEANPINISVPLVFGGQFSSISTQMNPVLSTFNLIELDGSSTSIHLSDFEIFPTFSRVVSSDALQAKGIVHLCKTLGWNTIGVLYTNDNYGVYFSSKVLENAELLGKIQLQDFYFYFFFWLRFFFSATVFFFCANVAIVKYKNGKNYFF